METTALDILKTLLGNSESTYAEDWSLMTSLNTKLQHLPHEEQIYYHQRIVDLMDTRRNYTAQLQDLILGLSNYEKDTEAKADAGMPAGLFDSLRDVKVPDDRKDRYENLVNHLEQFLRDNGMVYTISE